MSATPPPQNPGAHTLPQGPRLHTPQTAVTHYVAEFTIAARKGSHAEAFGAATETFQNWAGRKRRMADFAIRNESFAGRDSAPNAWAVHLQHREYTPRNDYRRHWHVDVAMQKMESGYDVRVMVAHALDHSFVGWEPPAPDPTAPAFVYDWLAHENLVLRSGQFPIAILSPLKPGNPSSLKERINALNVDPAHGELLARLVFDPNRSMPVLVINGDVNPITFPVNPHQIQRLMLGMCYVVWAPSAAGWGPVWHNNFPEGFECPMNTVRLYQPGALRTHPSDAVRHRFFNENEIRRHGGTDALVKMIRDGITRRLLAPRAGRLTSCEDVLALRAADDFNAQRSKLKSKDEELALYSAEYDRLVGLNRRQDQLLQEADSELQRKTTELEALRPHAAELAAQLQAAKESGPAVQSVPDYNTLLLRFYKNEASVADQLKAISLLFPESVQVLPTAWRSAEEASRFEFLDTLRDLLFKLVVDYRNQLVAGKGSQEASRVFGRNEFTTKESDNLTQKGRLARTFRYNGKDKMMEQHLKIGVKESDARCLRLHFDWDAANARIIIGHCGKHLPL